MKKIILTIIMISGFLTNLYSDNLPRYIMNGNDTIGVMFSISQAQQIDNTYDLVEVLTKTKLDCDSLQKYWIRINDENGNLLTLFKAKDEKQTLVIDELNILVQTLKQQVEEYQDNEYIASKQIEIKKIENQNLKKDLLKATTKSIIGWTGTTTGYSLASGIGMYFLLKKN